MTHQERIQLASKSLLGLSIGDAFGESFFGPTSQMLQHIKNREVPQSSWEFTDDTVMAIAVYEQLAKNGNIDQEDLSKTFARNHSIDPNRGYGATVRTVLREVENGAHFSDIAPKVFDGMGSMGNGAAMRVAPIGAYSWDDLDKVKSLCRNSSEVTHTNKEAIAGAIAVGVATAICTQMQIKGINPTPEEYLGKIVEYTPVSDTQSKIAKAFTLPYSYHIETVKTVLGNGVKMLAQDTVPFALWCVAHNHYSFEDALWKAVSALGDRDTICAIVGGIVIMSSKAKNIPSDWKDQVEAWNSSGFINHEI